MSPGEAGGERSEPEAPQPGATPREAAQTTESAGASEPTADPMAAYRTVRLHVTGMT